MMIVKKYKQKITQILKINADLTKEDFYLQCERRAHVKTMEIYKKIYFYE